MDAVRRAVGKVAGENKSSSSSSSFPLDLNGQSAQLSTASALVLTTTAPRLEPSYWEYSKFCAIFFVAGVVLGYTQNGRVKRWASNVLKLLKDN